MILLVTIFLACDTLFDDAMQLRRSSHPVSALSAAMAKHVEIVGSAIKYVNILYSGSGYSDLLDHTAPDFGLARMLQRLIRSLALGSGLTIKEFLPGQSEDLTRNAAGRHRC